MSSFFLSLFSDDVLLSWSLMQNKVLQKCSCLVLTCYKSSMTFHNYLIKQDLGQERKSCKVFTISVANQKWEQYLSCGMFKQEKWPVYLSLLAECFEEPLNRIEPTLHNHALGSNTLRCSDPNDFCHSLWRSLLSFTLHSTAQPLIWWFVDKIPGVTERCDLNILIKLASY